ncbi:MAG: hypothetical protein WAV30_01975 [Microgenomates group bacterium]
MNMIPVVHAEVNFGDTAINPVAKFNSIGVFTNIIIPIMMILGGFLTLSMLLYGAFTYLTSEGNADKVKKSQSILVYAILGLFLIVISFVLTRIIGTIFNVQMPL